LKEKSFFIVIDGIDGCGGTTHCNLLKEFLKSKDYKVHLTQEPSSSDIGILLRKYLKNKEIPPTTDALLFAADRTIHYHIEIKDKLKEGFIVISDRYIESSIAYQSNQTDEITIEWVKKINKFVENPGLTIILDIDPKIALERKNQDDLEKFENLSFLEKVRSVYLNQANEQGHKIINSDDLIENVQKEIQKIVIDKLQ
jgi:dTMP kinase